MSSEMRAAASRISGILACSAVVWQSYMPQERTAVGTPKSEKQLASLPPKVSVNSGVFPRTAQADRKYERGRESAGSRKARKFTR